MGFGIHSLISNSSQASLMLILPNLQSLRCERNLALLIALCGSIVPAVKPHNLCFCGETNTQLFKCCLGCVLHSSLHIPSLYSHLIWLLVRLYKTRVPFAGQQFIVHGVVKALLIKYMQHY